MDFIFLSSLVGQLFWLCKRARPLRGCLLTFLSSFTERCPFRSTQICHSILLQSETALNSLTEKRFNPSCASIKKNYSVIFLRCVEQSSAMPPVIDPLRVLTVDVSVIATKAFDECRFGITTPCMFGQSRDLNLNSRLPLRNQLSLHRGQRRAVFLKVRTFC